MRYGPSIQAIISAVIFTCLCTPARSQTVQIQVSDYHQHPIANTTLSGKGGGTSTCTTDIAGRAQILAPSGALPGDPLPLVLVRAPNTAMIIMSPYEGRATIPRPPGFIEVILGAPGDPLALKDTRVAWAWINAIVQLNRESFHPQDNLGKVAKAAGFTPTQLEDSMRSAMAKDLTEKQRSVAAEFRSQYGSMT